jgi:hypothetical protein
VGSWYVLHDHRGVGFQTALDRGGDFHNNSYCADCGMSFMVTIRSVFNQPCCVRGVGNLPTLGTMVSVVCH